MVDEKTINAVLDGVTLDELEKLRDFLKEKFEIFSYESVEGTSVRVINPGVEKEAHTLYRLVIGLIVAKENASITQLSMF